MASTLPYVPSSGSIKSALDRIRTAATPPRVTQDFVAEVLQVKGGTGTYVPPFLKRIGLVAPDGTPTELYKRFRNPATGGAAMAEAIRYGYKELSKANEYFYKLSDKDLLALIIQVTGADAESRAAAMTLSVLKVLKGFASFEQPDSTQESATAAEENNNGKTQNLVPPNPNHGSGQLGLNLSYTINLNLPATADQAVFNAIFRSLKEHLLSTGNG